MRRWMVGFSVALAAVLGGAGAVQAGEIAAVDTLGGYESGGVIVTLTGNDGDESVTVELASGGSGSFEPVHPAVRFSAHAYAGSLFGLSPGTSYRVRVTLSDPGGVSGQNPVTKTLETQPSYSLPSPGTTVWVASQNGTDSPGAGSRNNPYATIDYALEQAGPDTEIRVRPGTYGTVRVRDLRPPADEPIVVRAQDPNNRPVIDGSGDKYSLFVTKSSNLHFDGLVIENADTFNVRLRSSSRLVLRNSTIRDAGRANIAVHKGNRYPGGYEKAGRHLIANNEVVENDPGGCSGAPNQACPNQTYYGVVFDDKTGAGTVVRDNTFRGHVDNASLCGDEGPSEGRSLEKDAQVLPRNGGEWNHHDLAFHGNRIEGARDDNVEMDGICINARIFGNRIGGATNVFSIAPALPGPFFYLRNVVDAGWEQSAVKMNTAGQSDVPIRNHFFYHNTFVRRNEGHMLNLWYAHPQHNVPVEDVAFRNNIFWSKMGGRLTDALNEGSEHPSFDYDLWYTGAATTPKFEWWDGSQTRSYDTLKAFRMATGQEEHGLWGEPKLDSMLHPTSSSPAVDAAVRIEGINDVFSGSGPDIGAFEYQTGSPPGDAGDAGDATATDTVGGGGDTAGRDAETAPEVGSPEDAGGADTSSGDAQAAEGGSSEGCGCGAAGGGVPTPSMVIALIALGWYRRRRRR